MSDCYCIYNIREPPTKRTETMTTNVLSNKRLWGHFVMQCAYLVFNFDTSNASDSKHSPSAQSDEFEALSPIIML